MMFFLLTLLFIYYNNLIYVDTINTSINIQKYANFIIPTFNNKRTTVVVGRKIYLNTLSKNNFEVIQKKLEDIGIYPSHLEEMFVKGTGSGGQKVNKTNNCVIIKYKNNQNNNIIIKCHKYRCLQNNRIYARELLYKKITALKEKAKREIIHKEEKEKRKVLRLSEKEKNESINFKKRRSEIKKDRQKRIKYDDIY
ncbi:peptide chain release factor 2, putative [Plasmodium sp. gorilla clade G2]|uniref:peptide chain release factor 2, putative n=1 Tax=Plasmodium sp. gorilla clade G2 TaxID=880535 RepID=UPI000D225A69|nr:peptide chain release factor 2, putative [Plasmodium sp. gorilla clade G2]SOV11291.1 peptide chain release factor 2, putative [Plasmodium sp. gorilla clade G2]